MSISKKPHFLTIAAASLMMFCTQAGFAQPTDAQRAAMRSACPSDYEKYCASVPPGGAASLKCLQENAARLGSSCKAAVEAAGGGDQSKSTPPPATDPKPKAAAAEPAAPATAAVPDASAEKTATSPPMTLRQEIRLVRTSCGPEFRRLCAGVGLGGGRAIGCLEAKKESLSPVCKSALLQGPRPIVAAMRSHPGSNPAPLPSQTY